MKKRKCLKIVKMGLVVALALLVLVLPTSALYAQGDLNAPMYNSPIKFNISTYTGVEDSYVTELTPTIRYTSNGTSATELVQSSYYYDSNIDYDSYIGTWTFIEPLESIGDVVGNSDDVTYKFTFTYKINNTGEIKQGYGMRIRRIIGDDGIAYYVIYYLRDLSGSNQAVAYRSKYGEFSQNSFQTIDIQTEPPENIKKLLDYNGLRVSGNYGETVTYDNFSINTTIENGVLSVSYNLNAPTLSKIDGMKLKITAESGYLNPNLSSLPYIVLPEKISAVANGSYRVYDIDGSYQDYSITNRNIAKGGTLTLFSTNSIPPNYCYITNYEMTIELLVEEPSGVWGDAGYYQWNDVLHNYATLRDLVADSIYVASDSVGVGFVELPRGSMCGGFEIGGILIDVGYDNGDGYDVLQYYFETSGAYFLVYNMDYMEWEIPDFFEGDLTIEQVKTLYINGSINDIVCWSEPIKDAFIDFYRENTIYTFSPTIVGNSNGANKTYLFTVNYNVLNESLNKSTVRNFMSDYYSSVFSRGYNSNTNGSGGGVDYTSWIADAVGGFLDFQLFPNFSLGGLLGIVISFAVVVLFLKFFAGG